MPIGIAGKRDREKAKLYQMVVSPSWPTSEPIENISILVSREIEPRAILFHVVLLIRRFDSSQPPTAKEPPWSRSRCTRSLHRSTVTRYGGL